MDKKNQKRKEKNMSGNKALKRAFNTVDAARMIKDVPLIKDSTEYITPEIAQEMLKKNNFNRPVNWKKVEEYSDIMKKGEWKLHSQGIIFDDKGNLLTGQKRLWAIIYSDTPVLMRVSRGCPADAVRNLDRGEPQSSRDIAARETERKHSPNEISISRGVLLLRGINKPTKDQLADVLIEMKDIFSLVLKETKGTKKTKALLMIIAAICFSIKDHEKIKSMIKKTNAYTKALDLDMCPVSVDRCWGKGVAFVMAMDKALKIVNNN